jgi:flavin reductase (DIM6/NTAB) family NADH-FMN oxidoreductase RutF
MSQIITKDQIKELDRKVRLNLVNNLSGVKPANLVGTRASDGQSNLAIINSVVHIGSDPAMLGFIMRPADGVERHTLNNIRETGVFTINSVPPNMLAEAHYTSAKFDRSVSEFERCAFTEMELDGFKAPFVAESVIKIGLQLTEELEVKSNGTILIVGTIEMLHVPKNWLEPGTSIDLEATNLVGIGGLNTYYNLSIAAAFPYARVHEVPNFKK